jgi:hypothetical protein
MLTTTFPSSTAPSKEGSKDYTCRNECTNNICQKTRVILHMSTCDPSSRQNAGGKGGGEEGLCMPFPRASAIRGRLRSFH